MPEAIVAQECLSLHDSAAAGDQWTGAKAFVSGVTMLDKGQMIYLSSHFVTAQLSIASAITHPSLSLVVSEIISHKWFRV